MTRALESAAANLRGTEGTTFLALENYVGTAPFDPLTYIPWNTVFWASDPGQTPPSNGANVTSWRQPGSITTDEWASDGVATPTFLSSWVNGKPAVNFTGNARLSAAYAASNTLWLTAVIIGEGTGTNGDFCDDPSGSSARCLIDKQAGDWRTYRGGSVLAIAGANSNSHLIIARWNNQTTDYVKVDGATKISGTATGTASGTRVCVGVGQSGSHDQSRIAFGGFLTGRDLTTQEQTDLLTWFHATYKPAPTLVQTWSADYTTTTTPKASASLTWQTGDLIVVMAMSSETGTGWTDPTASGLTFSAHGTAITGGTRCNGHKWTATAASGGSGTISMGVTGGAQWGYTVWQFRSHGGAGGTTQALGSVATAVGGDVCPTVTLNGSQSAVCFIAGDRDAIAGGMSLSAAAGNPTPTERVDGTSSQYGFIVGDWVGCIAGTQTFTIPSGEYASRWMSYLVLEVAAR